MSRKHSKSNSSYRRVSSRNANQRLPMDVSLSRSIQNILSRSLHLIEDRRSFHPDGIMRPAASPSRRRHTLVAPKINRNLSTFAPQKGNWYDTATPRNNPRAAVAFRDAPHLAVCVRRKQREEVLHALKKTGIVGQRPPRRNYLSSISCKG